MQHGLHQEWLKAGAMVDGERTRSERGTPRGGIASPLSANVCNHYVFGLWAHHWRRQHGKRPIRVVRYADDRVMGFASKQDAERFLGELNERFARFGRFAAASRRTTIVVRASDGSLSVGIDA